MAPSRDLCASGPISRGSPCQSSGVGNRAQQGLRSEVSSERAEAWRAEARVRRDGTGSPEPASPKTHHASGTREKQEAPVGVEPTMADLQSGA